MLPFLAYSLLVDPLTPFVGAKMNEQKNWSIACQIRILEKFT